MIVKPLAFESLGVRSQATFVQSKDVTLVVDPSAALAPSRFGFPPHRREVERLLQAATVIEEHVRDAEAIIVTHYHYDHHDPGKIIAPTVYKNKIVILKDYEKNINFSQKVRALRFINAIREFAKSIVVADGREINIGNTTIKVSNPVTHGSTARLGYVVSVCIQERGDISLLFTSDVEGGVAEAHRGLLTLCAPGVAVVDGPPTYLLGYRFSVDELRKSLEFIRALVLLGPQTVIVDHHLCRDANYRSKLKEVNPWPDLDVGKLINAAEYLGVEPQFLEAWRPRLYGRSIEDRSKV